MTLANIQLSLLIGQLMPLPAPAELMRALQSVSINQSYDGPGGFQIVFRAERGAALSLDYALFNNPRLKPGSRVVLTAAIKGTPRVLMDGIIDHYQFNPASGSTGASLTVSGEDLTALMNMVEVSLEYPGMGDWEIALLVLAKYAALGVMPVVIPPLSSPISDPLEEIPQQSDTDRGYLQALAAKHSYVFSLQPGPVPLMSQAYWGPLIKIGLPQKALTVDMGAATNVESINFTYDAQTPTQVYGAVSDADTELVVPVLTMTSTNLPPLVMEPALLANQPFVRKSMLRYQGPDALEGQQLAQAITNQSTEAAVTASGTLDVLRYGDVLTAPGLVGVRGVGQSYDGYYYVKSVDHQLSPGEYKQNFTLSREGLGSLIPEVRP